MAKLRKLTKISPIPTVLITIGLILIGLWGVHRYFYSRSMSLSDTLLTTYIGLRPITAAYPIHIKIDGITDIPIVESGRQNGVWTISQTNANHVIQSALPGEGGNIIIYGHNVNTIFGYLMNIKVGTIVTIRMTSGRIHRYQVIQTQIVSPNQTELLAPTVHEILTLYTCTGFMDSLRFVVRAVPTPIDLIPLP
jgi:LPXTG-site transpeptidase (sortase) family protein